MPTIPDVARPVLPQIFSRIGLFVGGDGVDMLILVRIEVVKWMDVQGRRLWLSRKASQTISQLLLKFVGEVFLGSEKDNSSLRY